MTDAFNWKTIYDAKMEEESESLGCERFHLVNETGTGMITAYAVFAGVWAVFDELNLSRCGKSVLPQENVIEINYCWEGRYECEVNERYCCYVGARDFSIGTVGRAESRGCFPTGHFSALSLFLEPEILAEREAIPPLDLGIDLNRVRALAERKPRYFILHENETVDAILSPLLRVAPEKRLPLLKLKVMELLFFLVIPIQPGWETAQRISTESRCGLPGKYRTGSARI